MSMAERSRSSRVIESMLGGLDESARVASTGDGDGGEGVVEACRIDARDVIAMGDVFVHCWDRKGDAMLGRR